MLYRQKLRTIAQTGLWNPMWLKWIFRRNLGYLVVKTERVLVMTLVYP